MTKPFGIAIACGGHEELLVACVRSIQRNCAPLPIAVTFDGFAPEADTIRLLASVGARVTLHEEQKGISTSWNAAISNLDDCDYVCVLNDDTEVAPAHDFHIEQFFKRNRHVKVACSHDRLTSWSVLPFVKEMYPRSWAYDRLPAETSLVRTIYGSHSFEQLANLVAHPPVDIPEFARCRMNGACFTLSRQCIVENGLFDEKFIPPGCSEDTDFWLRTLTRYGPDSMGSINRSFIHHIRTATISNMPREWANARVAANGVYYRSKWPRFRFGTLEDWFCLVNALPAGAEEPPFPEKEFWGKVDKQ